MAENKLLVIIKNNILKKNYFININYRKNILCILNSLLKKNIILNFSFSKQKINIKLNKFFFEHIKYIYLKNTSNSSIFYRKNISKNTILKNILIKHNNKSIWNTKFFLKKKKLLKF